MMIQALTLAMLLSGSAVFAAVTEPSQAQIEDIIQKFAAKESDFAKARENYTYRQSVRVLDLDESGNTRGKHEVVTDVIFSQDGKRTEKVVRAPVDTLKAFNLDPGDEQDLRNVQPFVLTSAEIPKYFVRYLGKETLDEISCYVFAVKPKKVEAGQRYFTGLVWVDDRDLQIVKSYGRGTGVAKKEHRYPKFETYREQIDGKYWFPTYTIANDTLMFDSGPARMKLTVKYEDYKQFKSDTKIIYSDEVEKTKDQPKEPPKKQP